MKKFIKIFLVSLLSLVGVLIVAISIVIWIVFTPEKLTPIVRKQATKYITCKSEIGSVELTFFSTFPNFGLKVTDFALINPVAGSVSDTLVRVNELVGVVDAKAYWKKKDIILIGLQMNHGSVNVYSDSLGHKNYNIMPPEPIPAPADTSESVVPLIDIRNIDLKDISLHYNDLSLKLNTVISNLSAQINGKISGDSISGNVNVNTSVISVEYIREKLNTEIHDLSAKINGTVIRDNICGTFKVSSSMMSLNYGGEKYLQKASVVLDLPLDIVTSRQFITLKNATASINDMEIMLNGTIENDTVSKNITTDLTYKLVSWPVKNFMAIVPPSYKLYFDGIDADGLLSSDGSIKGTYNASQMPVMDMHLLFEKGTLKYAAFPSLPLHDVDGDITLHTDLLSDSLSFVRINRFTAKTPGSSFRTEGMVTHLFKDITFNLTTTAGLALDEFNSIIPESMKTTVSGKASGQVKSRFTMTQLEKMQIEKMKLAGSVTLSDFDVKYDSISLKTDRSKIDFTLPNNKPLSKSTGFLYASIISDNIEAGKIVSYNAVLKKSSFIIESSDIRDTTRIPDLICSFGMESISAGMDDMTIAIASPLGIVSVSPVSGKSDQPHISLLYNSGELKTTTGKNTVTVNKISTNLDILNDNTQKDIFLQWLVKGYIDVNQCLVNMADFTHKIEIPSVKMDFDPESFIIKESSMRIGKSDFQLTGNLNNVLSYFRGDSILTGRFNFVSNKTDVAQLMALTSGIGSFDSTSVKHENTTVDTISTGPYMVPRKMDVILNANIGLATMGVDTATNIKGAVRVHDGILLLDGLTFDTPAARMQLTAMYQTPRKNHLFLGIDYHMLDVEISELLTMIPDIDTLMPMLRSFGGRGEFHIAAETYLDSAYNIKKSTLRGASSIKGNNLVLMDGQTFSEIAKKLKFSKKTENKVDSLSAEFTIFRNEIDVYPFLIVMDKYKAVIAGRHNFDMTFDYHVSVVDCPIPLKLGVDIKGNPENMSYKLAKCRYAQYFRPSARHEVENKQLELRKMIRQTLAEKVRE